jgi:transposase
MSHSGTSKVKHRAATALRMGANSLCRAKGSFGEFFRHMRAKLGTAQAITTTAHKIARIFYHVLLTKEPYAETAFHRCDEQAQRRAVRSTCGRQSWALNWADRVTLAGRVR